MKKQNVSVMGVILVAFMIIGCAQASGLLEQSMVPDLKSYELDGLYVTTDEKQMGGVAKDHAKLTVGESVVIYARGNSTEGKWFKLPSSVAVTWKADSELKVTPASGHTVTVRVVKPISTTAYVTAVTTAKNGKKVDALFTIEGKK